MNIAFNWSGAMRTVLHGHGGKRDCPVGRSCPRRYTVQRWNQRYVHRRHLSSQFYLEDTTILFFFYNFIPDIISMRIFQIAIDIVESWLRLDGRLGRHGGSLRNMSRRWDPMRDHGRCLRQKWRAGIQGGNHCPQWIEKHQNRRDWEQ